MKILILGVNGFIGHHLTKRILDETDWSVFGMDLSDDRLGKSLQNPRFHFIEGDIAINRESTLRQALSIMLGQGVRSIPVVDENAKFVGEVSLADVEVATAEKEENHVQTKD